MGFKLPNGSDLSEEQLDIINLPVTQDWVIKGAPGTGKTVMAIYRAGQASQMSKGRPVLMLVYNRPLMQFLSSAIQGNYYKNVSVYTYSRWISELYSEYGLGSVPKVYNQYDWQKISAQLSGIKNLYSHVIIDEAQEMDEDAQASFLPAISASLNPQTIYVGTPPDPNASGGVPT